MAAAAAVVKQKTLRSKSPTAKVKRTLGTSYPITWPELQRGDNKAILDEIRRDFPPLLLQRNVTRSRSTPSGTVEQDSDDHQDVASRKQNKSHLCIGINEVTRGLEQGKLKLVLVCRSAKPSILTNHLVLLSASRATPACALHGLSEVMSPVLGIKTVMACGFKKKETETVFDKLVDFIIEKTPKIEVPWIDVWNGPGIDKEMRKRRRSSTGEQGVDVVNKEESIQPAKSNTEGTPPAAVVTHLPIVGDTEGKSGNICTYVETQGIGQSALKKSKFDEETKRRKLQDVSIDYQKVNVKTLVCRKGKKKKNKKLDVSVQRKNIPSAEHKRMVHKLFDDELQKY